MAFYATGDPGKPPGAKDHYFQRSLIECMEHSRRSGYNRNPIPRGYRNWETTWKID